jgi:hypothetical protein
VRFQKLMWYNMMKSTKSKKVSVLHYSIDSVEIGLASPKKEVHIARGCSQDFD